MDCVLGLDISTTATKALLLDGRGGMRGSASSTHPLSTPRPLWSEQNPEDWWLATCTSIQAVLKETGTTPDQILGVGLAGQMHGLVLLDGDLRVLRPAILWNDQRASRECDLIRNALGLDRLVAITGNDAFPGFSAPKLLWVRHHEPEVYRRIRHVLLPKDFIRLRLTGSIGTDRAGAGGTLLLDLRSRDWSPEVLSALDIPPQWLPPTHEGPQVTGRVSDAGALATGLTAGVPVVGGAGDQAAQAVGVGAIRPETFALTVGTSGVVFAPCSKPTTDPRGRVHAFPHAIPGVWHVMGVMLSAAGSLQWYRDTLAPGVPFDLLVEEAERVSPGCEGLTFLPYLSGERTPHADPAARGAFVGLTLRHGRGHLTRAVLEGVAFGLRDNLHLLAASGLPSPRALHASGGALKSPVWRQILADVLATPLTLTDASEGAALGAALLAGTGASLFPTIEEAVALSVVLGDVVEPGEARGAYRAPYERFRALYPVLAALPGPELEA